MPWKRLRNLLLTILVLGGIGLLGLMGLENHLIYHPTTAANYWEPPRGFPAEDVWLKGERGERIHAWWCPVDHARWVVLYCHGNAGNLSQRQTFIQNWRRIVGASVLICDYPGFGKSEGKPSEAGCLAAGKAASDWLEARSDIAARQIVLYGKSLGGAIALSLARARPHGALILHSAFTSMPDMAQRVLPFLPSRWLVRTQFDNLSAIREYPGPLLIVHGARDDLIPIEHGRRLFEAAPGPRKRFFAIPGADHYDIAPPLVYEEFRSFLGGLQREE